MTPFSSRRALARIATLALLSLASGCNVLNPRDCTLIGCVGLLIEVGSVPAQTQVTMTLTAPDGSSRSRTMTCGSGTCIASFPDFTPPTVTIRVTTADRSSEVTTQPAYEVTHPNGRGCPPECRTARVTVTL